MTDTVVNAVSLQGIAQSGMAVSRFFCCAPHVAPYGRRLPIAKGQHATTSPVLLRYSPHDPSRFRPPRANKTPIPQGVMIHRYISMYLTTKKYAATQ